MTIPSFETVIVHSLEAVCDGGKNGHPRIFLHLYPDTRQVVCPYCSRIFVLADGAPATATHG